MRVSKLIIGGCLIGASFFVACQEAPQVEASSLESSNEQPEEKKTLEVKQASELAMLMRSMYEENLEVRKGIMEGEIPGSFPEDFVKIHSAQSAENLNETYYALAEQYTANLEAITKAETKEEGIKAYNGMVNTCASCHTIYCQGPLAKIKKMRIPAPGES